MSDSDIEIVDHPPPLFARPSRNNRAEPDLHHEAAFGRENSHDRLIEVDFARVEWATEEQRRLQRRRRAMDRSRDATARPLSPRLLDRRPEEWQRPGDNNFIDLTEEPDSPARLQAGARDRLTSARRINRHPDVIHDNNNHRQMTNPPEPIPPIRPRRHNSERPDRPPPALAGNGRGGDAQDRNHAVIDLTEDDSPARAPAVPAAAVRLARNIQELRHLAHFGNIRWVWSGRDVPEAVNLQQAIIGGMGFAIENPPFPPDFHLDYALNGFEDLPRPDPPRPPYNALPPAPSGYSRNTGEETVAVCPSCSEELDYDPDEGLGSLLSKKKPRTKKDRAEYHFMAVKACGHVFCRGCFEARRSLVKNLDSSFRQSSAHKTHILCAVEGCDSEVGAKNAWVGVFT